MSSSKHLTAALGLGFALATLPSLNAFAAPTPSFDGAISAAPAVSSVKTAAATANAPHGVSAAHTAASSISATQTAVARVASAVPASQPASPVVAPASDTHLTLRDIDQLARNKVARALRDGDEPGAGAAAAAKAAPAARAETPPPVPTFVAPAVVRTPRVDPVNFVGSFFDGAGAHVLYEYDGAVYPARLGEKLLNGWIVRKVDGLFVTVAQGKAIRTVAMRGSAPDSAAPAAGAGPVAVSGPLRDLGAPLPTWIAPSAAQ
ncbi:hypothetical protein PXJ20_26965 [Paraburkholderia sp. A1RI_3L]|uniref:hypothetical protein n=1 Tax=Paraburkholderia TaxID=1822464 RepID=UPI000F86296D|nr:hypothetical protein [Paraburkholderia kururiensis]